LTKRGQSRRRWRGTTPESWLRQQENYDLRIAEKKLAGALKKIPRLEAAS
jgi:plasmid maintenance system antidote protein VapI